MNLIDIGVNLTNKAFSKDLEEVIQRAFEQQVTQMLLTGTSIKSSLSALELANTKPGLYSTAGIHPHDAKTWSQESYQTLKQLSQEEKVVAIGECGLDFNRNFSTPEEQELAFTKQIELAIECNLPLFLHERDAHQKMLEIVRSFGKDFPPAVIHCFTGNQEQLATYLSCGFYIGITGWICDERRGLELQQIVHTIPLDRILLETDAPYLTPRDMRPKPKKGRNEPAFLPHIMGKVAECMNVSKETLATHATQNTRQLFSLPSSS